MTLCFDCKKPLNEEEITYLENICSECESKYFYENFEIKTTGENQVSRNQQNNYQQQQYQQNQQGGYPQQQQQNNQPVAKGLVQVPVGSFTSKTKSEPDGRTPKQMTEFLPMGRFTDWGTHIKFNIP